MANDFGLFIEQNNKQIISPQMYQAIEIIQLSLPELIDYINNELVENPLIEVSDDYETPSFETDSAASDSLKAQEQYDKWVEGIVEDVLQDEKDNWTMPNRAEREISPVEGCWFDNSNLQEYLMEQLRFIRHNSKISDREFQAAEYIIGNLDDNGYLTTALEEIASTLEIPQAVVKKALAIVQQLDPPGIGARDLKECLRLQLPLIPDCPSQMESLLDHLDDLASGFHKKIASALGVSVEEVRAMGELLKLLDPKPGSRFDQGVQTKYIIPDAVIKKIGDEYFVLVNESGIPRICINEEYKRVLQSQDEQVIKKYLKEKVGSAINLLKSIEHRRSTIHDVLAAIVRRQKEFFEVGVSGLKPLTMKEIAEELGLHESTVSRVSSNKYVQTPMGLCTIKCFFAGSIGREKEVSPEKIKEDLKKIIADEDPGKPFSDQDLTDIFVKKGIAIARRTIAKYREELRIPSSSLRKKSKR